MCGYGGYYSAGQPRLKRRTNAYTGAVNESVESEAHETEILTGRRRGVSPATNPNDAKLRHEAQAARGLDDYLATQCGAERGAGRLLFGTERVAGNTGV